jgi:NADPH:quinone reductase
MGSKSALFTILDHVKAGRLRSVVDMVFPLDQAVEAHRRLEGRQTSGKVILRVERT